MPISYAESTEVTCPQCDHSFSFDAWLIVAADKRPDLVERIRAETIHTLTCPQCGQTFGAINAPLLLYRPKSNPPILFSPAQQTTNEQDQQQQTMGLVGRLRERLGAAWREEWLAQGLPGVQRTILPVVLADDPESMLIEPKVQAQHEIEELREREPKTLTLVQSLNAFLESNSWNESYFQVQSHPELLSSDVIALLNQAIAEAQASNQGDAAAFIAEHRDLLCRCNEIGMDAAFAEKLDVAVEQLRGQSYSGATIPPVFAPWLTEAQQAEQRFRQIGDRTALNHAVAAWQTILAHTDFSTSQHDFRLAVLNNAGSTYLSRYWSQGCVEDLNRALDLWEEVVQTTAPDSPDLPGYLNNLGTGLRSRYARTGRLEDLEQAIHVYQQAVQTTPPNLPDLPGYLNNLGIGLRLRYARTGQLEDLEQALRVAQQAVQITPPDSPDLPGYLNNFGTGLSDRYVRTGRLEDLEQALCVAQQAV
ncbi:MAG: tetratricopeptide repeat protein, partial [Chloroflexia bacterium]|nr:tetratricopeptide repeat protein [Chloroflexia bacterium]